MRSKVVVYLQHLMQKDVYYTTLLIKKLKRRERYVELRPEVEKTVNTINKKHSKILTKSVNKLFFSNPSIPHFFYPLFSKKKSVSYFNIYIYFSQLFLLKLCRQFPEKKMKTRFLCFIIRRRRPQRPLLVPVSHFCLPKVCRRELCCIL